MAYSHKIPLTSPLFLLLIPAIYKLHAYLLLFVQETMHALPNMVVFESIEADMVLAEPSRDPPGLDPTAWTLNYTYPPRARR